MEVPHLCLYCCSRISNAKICNGILAAVVVEKNDKLPFSTLTRFEKSLQFLNLKSLNTKKGMNGYNDEKMAVTNSFMKTLQLSGYNEDFKKQTALSAFKGGKKMVEREEAGGRKVYRLQTEGAAARYKKKLRAKSEWFKGKQEEEIQEWETSEKQGQPGPVSTKSFPTLSTLPLSAKPHGTLSAKPVKENHSLKKDKNGQKKDERQCEGVIFVPYTVDGKLRSRLQHEDDKLTRVMRMPRLRFVERPGRTVADSLVTKDPWYRLQGGCSKQNCPVCFWSKGVGIRCTRENVGYRLD